MSQFFGLVRYEYRMTVQRGGLWFAFGVLYALYGFMLFAPSEAIVMRGDILWQTAGQVVFRLNLFMPLLGGIIAADRLYRDYRIGVRELQVSAPLGDWTYILAKYLGVLAGTLTPVVVFVVAVGAISVPLYHTPVEFLAMLLVAMLMLTVPAFAFVTVFSLACPLVMPVRVYQVLFTGYWFWGNFLSPKVMPTLSDTPLAPGGMWVFQGLFGGFVGAPSGSQHTPAEAALNLAVLAVCVVVAFIVLRRYMEWQANRV